MDKIWLLTKSNLRKNREQAVPFLIITILTAMMMNLGLITLLRYDSNYDKKAQEQSSAHVIIAIQNTVPSYVEELGENLRNDHRTAELEKRQVMLLAGACDYRGSRTQRRFAVMNGSDAFKMGRISYVMKLQEEPSHPIYLPYIFQVGGGYELGDTFILTISGTSRGEQNYQYEVAGFYEETMLGTINSSTTGLILTDFEYQRLSQEYGGTLSGSLFSVRLKEPLDNEIFCSDYIPSLPQETALSDAVFYDMVKEARTITSDIGAMIILAFSFIMTIIALIVVRFRIANSIEGEMMNIGALEAIGYTGRQISVGILLQFLLLALIGTLLGTAAAYLLLPGISYLFALQTGVIWDQGFDGVSTLFTAVFVLLVVSAVSWLSTGRVRRLSPIVALRSGILTHSFRKNPFPLEKSRGNLNILLAMKGFCQSTRRNLLVGFIVGAISFAALFACVLYDNISLNFDRYLQHTVGEIYSVRLVGAGPEASRELLEACGKKETVRKSFFMYEDSSVKTKEGSQIMCYANADYKRYDYQDRVYEGRFPRYENEVALGGLLAKDLKKQVGDTISLEREGHQFEYLITGLIQGSNYLGRDAALTEEGYRQLNPEFEYNAIAVYLAKDAEITEFVQEIKGEFGDRILEITDYKKLLKASLGSYQDIVSMLTLVILVVTGLIVVLTLYLVIKTLLLRKRKELGIQKAIGFTTGQLAFQTALGLLPVVLLGAMAGQTAGWFCINPLLSLLFSGIGIMKVNFSILPGLAAGICVGIAVFGFLVSLLVAVRIRRITPILLITD